MKTTKLLFVAMIFAGASSLALAQHGGHSGGFGYPGHDHSAEDLQRKIKIQANEGQRAQLRTCLELTERLRMVVADMRDRSDQSATQLARIRQRWSQLLRQSMQSDHEAFLNSLNADQQAALKDRLQKMDKTWSELASRYDETDRDLAQSAPDTKRLADQAKDLEKSLKKWQKQHRELGSEMGVEG